MKDKIIIKYKDDLEELIKQEIELNGNECDLNHIDVSQVDDMCFLFANSEFNGNISEWDVSSVKDMSFMFDDSQFNGDISKWNVSNVTDMRFMFYDSQFNGNISGWTVSNVENINGIFQKSKFNKDICEWKPYSLKNLENSFENSNCPIPYWAKIQDKEKRNIAIDNYLLNKQLNEDLNISDNNKKKPKI